MAFGHVVSSIIGFTTSFFFLVPNLKKWHWQQLRKEKLKIIEEALEKAEERAIRYEERHDRILSQICSYYLTHKELEESMAGARAAMNEALEFAAALRKIQMKVLRSFPAWVLDRTLKRRSRSFHKIGCSRCPKKLSLKFLVEERFSMFSTNSILRAAAMATAVGVGLLDANCRFNIPAVKVSIPESFTWQTSQGKLPHPVSGASHQWQSEVTVKVSIPEFLRDAWSLPWRLSQVNLPLPISGSSFQWQHGMLPLFSSRAVPVPSSDVKGDSGASEDRPEHCCECLRRNTIANAAAIVGPAVVNISFAKDIYGAITVKHIGTGTIIDNDGTILTCAHTIVDFHGLRASPKGKVDVTLQDGRSFVATVENVDLHSDIAIIKINSKTPLPTAKLGSSSKLRPGDWVIAMGCPLSLQNTITAGIVSCVDRKSSDLGLGGMREYLQTDCAINQGNSGGPLVNVDGEVVGVNLMKMRDADGVSFAIPIDTVSKIIEHLKKSGRVIRPWLGLKMFALNKMVIAQLKERDPTFPNVDKGILVAMVTPGSPGDRAGFLPNDVVIEFDGKPVESISEIIEIMGDRIGVPLKAVVERAKDKQVTLTVTPEEYVPEAHM
ncbi:hypothetical protein FNV43_RR04965 [Rhamnella rubrinervis]|uniref:PDZ domain-containing protein n=1 Tax=Rhamnella rubrinervis TaxID=2594499 RepID=A0A8K0HKK9_9ROSA|nr:hypothetical protein FNV43_RR04965 [Rhamnella rubrinervis]